MITQKYNFRFAVILNYIGILLLLVLFYLVRLHIIDVTFLIIEIIPLGVIILSFRQAFIKSGVWRMTHKSNQKLDEREMHVVLRATNISYSVFVSVVLIIIYLFLLCGFEQIDAVIAISLLYISHILPASILAWNERNHEIE